MAGRPSRLRDPEFCQLIAQLYIRGVDKAEMAEELDCNEQTISRWVRDPRVQVHATNMARERVNRITRRIDSEMEARLAHVSKWKLDDLLKVRKEFLERSIKIQSGEGVNLADATADLSEAFDQNPELAEQLEALVNGKGLPAPAPEDVPDLPQSIFNSENGEPLASDSE